MIFYIDYFVYVMLKAYDYSRLNMRLAFTYKASSILGGVYYEVYEKKYFDDKLDLQFCVMGGAQGYLLPKRWRNLHLIRWLSRRQEWKAEIWIRRLPLK